METGEEATDLQIPPDYRKRMVNPSKQSLVSTPVSLPQCPSSASFNDNGGRGLTGNPNTGSAKSTVPPLPPRSDHIARHNRLESNVSKDFSSVTCDGGSAAGRTRHHESPSGYESMAILTNPNDLQQPLAVLVPQPLQLLERTETSLGGNSVTNQTATFLLDDSSNESKPATTSSVQQGSESDCAGAENLYETGSEPASSRSSESVEGHSKVRHLQTSHTTCLTAGYRPRLTL